METNYSSALIISRGSGYSERRSNKLKKKKERNKLIIVKFHRPIIILFPLLSTVPHLKRENARNVIEGGSVSVIIIKKENEKEEEEEEEEEDDDDEEEQEE